MKTTNFIIETKKNAITIKTSVPKFEPKKNEIPMKNTNFIIGTKKNTIPIDTTVPKFEQK